VVACAAVAVAVATAGGSPAVAAHGAGFTTRIQHVVYVIQENHSFDNVLGAWCVHTGRCDGATTGLVKGVGSIPLTTAKDKVVEVAHSAQSQTDAIDRGAMDGFARILHCARSDAYKCYTQYTPPESSITNVLALANNFSLSDRTFEDGPVSSWGMHVEAVAGTEDGFVDSSTPIPGTKGVLNSGWGCDSGRDTIWQNPVTGVQSSVPACVPDAALDIAHGGAYRSTPVPYVPTIMDRLDAAGLSWKLYGGPPTGSSPGHQGDNSGNGTGYGWAICPTFAECLYGSPSKMVDNSQFTADAKSGNLPNFSVVTPTQTASQHNGDSMTVGDNWLGSVVSAVEKGPDWSSTAIFITWDDCGCFYDHVVPPAGLGIRVPMLIVSPYARPGFTDHTTARFASVLAFTETAFGLPPITPGTTWDSGAYNYWKAFDFTHARRAPVSMTTTPVTPAMLQSQGDPEDPT
jgi:phospholipase C